MNGYQRALQCLKLRCKYKDYTAIVTEGCNCLILQSMPGFGSFGGIEDNAVYDSLVRENKLIDLRPYLPFKNWDQTGRRPDLSDKWWDEVIAKVMGN